MAKRTKKADSIFGSGLALVWGGMWVIVLTAMIWGSTLVLGTAIPGCGIAIIIIVFLTLNILDEAKANGGISASLLELKQNIQKEKLNFILLANVVVVALMVLSVILYSIGVK